MTENHLTKAECLHYSPSG